jgi:hypothetical protein
MDLNYAPVAYFILVALAAIIIGIAFALGTCSKRAFVRRYATEVPSTQARMM